MADFLLTPLTYLKGAGALKAEVLSKEINLHTCADLLTYYPFRYVDRTRWYKIAEVDPGLAYIQIEGKVVRKEIAGEKSARRLQVWIKDETGLLELVWFKGISYTDRALVSDQTYVFFGKPTLFQNKINIVHPEFENLAEHKSSVSTAFQPVYPSTEKLKKFFLDSRGIARLVAQVIQHPALRLPETLPGFLLGNLNLISRERAIRGIHFPGTSQELQAASLRLKFEEFFFIQLKMLRMKQNRIQKSRGFQFITVGRFFNHFYAEKLPFELTDAQKKVLKEIRKDTLTGHQMNRLLQGDVGSGKTVVALLTMLLAIDNGFQACMMAPTEILARQHEVSLKELLGDDFVKVGILTGSSKKADARKTLELTASGEIKILVGTHSLIEDRVIFSNLGLVIIDEQHRFGVQQRARLWAKNMLPPHVLVMTATPIPRTLAMTLYGDLDISVINELPKGRKPIQTLHFYESRRLRLFGLLKEEIARGRQVYVVYPLIEESEKTDYLNLFAGFEQMERSFPKPDYQISIVHGKMKAADKQAEMQRFIRRETQILVATTVIEVGVNVPNASVMVIESAERFGLSTLHQLRGRVGRGSEQSYCILMSGNKLSADGKLRLETMVRTNDGFEIAETDLLLRGPGDLEGTQQSGVLDLKLANLSKDQSVLHLARNTVLEILDEDPMLELEKHRLLHEFFEYKRPGNVSWEQIS